MDGREVFVAGIGVAEERGLKYYRSTDFSSSSQIY